MLLDYFFASEDACRACHERLAEVDDLCWACHEKLDFVYQEAYIDKLDIDLAYPLFYNNYLKGLMARFKFQGETQLYKAFAKIMYKSALRAGFLENDPVLVPVPLYKRAQSYRGYNQSYLLAKGLKDLTGLRLRKDLLVKLRDTKEQNKVSRRERANNLKDSIEIINEDFYEENIILIDDIYTSGHTIKSILDARKGMGRKIKVLVLASGRRIEF